MIRDRSQIPAKMTSRTVDAVDLEPGDRSLGIPLTRRMVAWLDTAPTVEERLQQLEEIDSRAYRAYCLRRVGRQPVEIATSLHVSLRTAQRLLLTAYTFLERGQADPIERLLVRHPQAFAVLVMREHGWTMQRVADTLGLTFKQVEWLAVVADRAVGREGIRRRRHSRTVLAGSK